MAFSRNLATMLMLFRLENQPAAKCQAKKNSYKSIY